MMLRYVIPEKLPFQFQFPCRLPNQKSFGIVTDIRRFAFSTRMSAYVMFEILVAFNAQILSADLSVN